MVPWPWLIFRVPSCHCGDDFGWKSFAALLASGAQLFGLVGEKPLHLQSSFTRSFDAPGAGWRPETSIAPLCDDHEDLSSKALRL